MRKQTYPTNAQKRALRLLAAGNDQWHTVYSLGERLQTLTALVKRGYAERKYNVGDTAVQWKITQAGFDYVAS